MDKVAIFEVLIVLILVAVFIYVVTNRKSEVAIVKSNVDGRNYLVQNIQDKQQAADLLGAITNDLIKLVQHMKAQFPDNPSVKRLVDNFNPNNISEAGQQDMFTSYSINKGEKLVFCIRTRDSENNLQSKNLLMYVAIHELAHLMTKETGHTDTFWENNKTLLREAVKINVYEKIDFDKEPAKYCGIKIATSII